MRLLRFAALTGNILLALWISFNAMDSGFQGTIYEKLSCVFMLLLALNSILLLKKGDVSQ